MAFTVTSERNGDDAILRLTGELDAAASTDLRTAITASADPAPTRLLFYVGDLTYMASAGLRTLVFARQHMGEHVEIILIGIQPAVRETLELTGFQHSVTLVDSI